MAFSLTRTFSWTTTIYSDDTAIKSSSPSSLHHFPSNFFTIRPPHLASPSHPLPSPYCSCRCSVNSNVNVRERSKILSSLDDRAAISATSSPELSPLDGDGKVRRIPHVALTAPGDGDGRIPISSALTGAKQRTVRFKHLFNKRSLWKRIFFASRKVRSIMLLNVITIVYASNIPVVKEVGAIVDPAAFSVVRFAIAAVPFLPFVMRSRNDAHTRSAGMELGLWVSLGYLMQALGLLTSDAGRASFMSMLTVIVVPLLDGILGAKVPTRTWFGALMSILGVSMLESSGSPPSVGDLLNFLSAIFFGIHMLRTERISRVTRKENFLPLLGYEVSVIAFCSLMWYFIGGWFGGARALDPNFWSWHMFWNSLVSFPWIPALYTGFFSTGLCLWIEMAAMMDVSATETAIIYSLEPVWGAGFAWFLLGERWGTLGWVGAALVLGGSLTVQLFGSLPSSRGGEDEERVKKDENHLVFDKRNGFSTSPVVISSRKIQNILEK